MARPEKFEDLADYEKQPREFVRVDLQHLTVDLGVGAAVLTLIDTARKSEAFEVDEDGVFAVSVPLTEKEKEHKVASAQRTWDYNEADYEAAIADVKLIERWRRSTLDHWASVEDREPVDWYAHDAAFEGVPS